MFLTVTRTDSHLQSHASLITTEDHVMIDSAAIDEILKIFDEKARIELRCY
jgi:hypothetical protein